LIECAKVCHVRKVKRAGELFPRTPKGFGTHAQAAASHRVRGARLAERRDSEPRSGDGV
jgi:hypothetical protein